MRSPNWKHSTSAFTAVAILLLRGVSAINLFVSAYDGNVTTLSLAGSNGNYSLSATSKVQACGTQPSWLVHDKPNKVLYCMDENWNALVSTPNATSIFTSYTVGDNGKLSVAQTQNISTISSVSAAMSPDKKSMVVAGYSGQVSAMTINKTAFKQTQIFNYTGKTEPGPVTARQATSHVHQTVLDPSGRFLVMPDLGADLLRVYSWSGQAEANAILTEQASFKVKAGSGPRHAAFWKVNQASNTTDGVYLFLVNEIEATIASYKVSYPAQGGLGFTELSRQDTVGGERPNGIPAPAEIQLSPDNKYLLLSNRNDSSFQRPITGTNLTELSDSLAAFEIGNNGTLAFKQLSPAGGLFPRQFALNKAGNLVAVGLQTSCQVVIMSRDVKSGLLGKAVAEIPLGNCVQGAKAEENVTNGPTCIVWDE